MLHYSILIIFTALIIYLSVRIWRKTKEIAFLAGIALIYYWTLLGAWFVIFDNLTGDKGKEFGLHYYYLFERLFPVKADQDYAWALVLYGIFIVALQVVVLYFTKRKSSADAADPHPIRLNQPLLILTCVAAALLSFSLVWKEILTAAKFNQSVYVITRSQPGPLFTIHQLLNEGAVAALYIGFISWLCGDQGRYIRGDGKKTTLAFYILGIFFVEGYLLFLGNKREIMFGGIMAILFYLYNVQFRINYKWLAAFVIIIATPLFFNDGLRSYSPTFLARYFDTTGLEYHPLEEVVYSEFSMKNAAFTFLFSNEMFCAHFSMYGVLHNHVPLTYGTSLVSLGASVVPHFLWHDRPADIYKYYIEHTSMAHVPQGFTIHHATAWYLNFGVIGILTGAAALGWIWALFYNRFLSIANEKRTFLKLFFTIGLAAFTAQLPSLIRGGPEGYKAMLFEALLLPVLVLWIAAKFVRRS